MGLIRTTFEIVTPESAEHGDTEDRGWIDEEGSEMTVEEAIKCVRGLEPSSSGFHVGIWYTDSDYHTDYQTGAVESRSYHLKGFSEEEEREIYVAVTGGKD